MVAAKTNYSICTDYDRENYLEICRSINTISYVTFAIDGVYIAIIFLHGVFSKDLSLCCACHYVHVNIMPNDEKRGQCYFSRIVRSTLYTLFVLCIPLQSILLFVLYPEKHCALAFDSTQTSCYGGIDIKVASIVPDVLLMMYALIYFMVAKINPWIEDYKKRYQEILRAEQGESADRGVPDAITELLLMLQSDIDRIENKADRTDEEENFLSLCKAKKDNLVAYLSEGTNV